MSTHPALEAVIADLRALPEDLQDEAAAKIGRMLEDIAEISDPERRAYVEQALEEGMADIEAGRVRPAEEVFDDLLKAIDRKHGL